MKIKNLAIVIFIIVLLVITASCKFFESNDNLRINYKENKLSNRGCAAAVYNNRIYYISNENGYPGIYSMKMDGSDIRGETVNPSITSLQVINDTMYFVGIKKIHESRSSLPTDSAYQHTIYKKVIGSSEYSIIKEAPDHDNITSFYLSPEGYIAFKTGKFYGETFIKDSVNNKNPIISSIAKKIELKYPNIEGITSLESMSDDLFIYQVKDLLCISHPYASEYKEDNIIEEFYGSERVNLINLKTNEIVINFDFNTDKRLNDRFQIITLDDRNIYCSYSDIYENKQLDFRDNVQINIINKENFEITDSFYLEEIDKNEKVSYGVEYNGKLYMIVDEWSSREKTTLPIKNEKLLAMDIKTHDCSIITEMEKGERIVGLTEDSVIYYKDNELFKAELNNDEIINREKLCEMSVNLNKDKFTIDYAGDWMFIYKIYGGFTYASVGNDMGQQLLYKINIKTGEVIENTVPIDFSELNMYGKTVN